MYFLLHHIQNFIYLSRMELKHALGFLRARLIALRKMRIYTEKHPTQSFCSLEEIETERKQIQKEVDYINKITHPEKY